MSTIADYSVFTKAFLASEGVNFSKLTDTVNLPNGNEGEIEALRAFAVVPLHLDPLLTTRGALNLDKSSWNYGDIEERISCRDADGKFIGNIVRVQPGVREGSIRLVAKVAVPAAREEDVADISVNTFVLLRADSPTNVDGAFSTKVDLPIAVATISKGYMLHKHLASEIDPLDDVENANYVSFTINNLNGYTSVDFNPDAYATYDDVANALSRGIDGLHIAFDTASGDLKLLDKDGNVLDQANLPIKTDVIIADGEEGYKYVKTDVKQDIHAAKAWMPEGFTAWDAVEEVPYRMQHAALVMGNASTPASREFVEDKVEKRHPISTESVSFDHVVIDGSTYMVADKNETETQCSLLKVKGKAGAPSVISPVNLSGVQVTHGDQLYTITNEAVEADVVKGEDVATTYVLTGHPLANTFQARALDGGTTPLYQGRIETSGVSSTGGVVGIAFNGTDMYTFEEGASTPSEFKDLSGHDVTWFGTKAIPEGYTLKYGLEAFVWTVKDAEAGDKITDPFFKQLNASLLALGFHEGDDIALGTNIGPLSEDLNGVDADEYIHGKDNKAIREQEVDAQRANAKEELVAWNAQHPALTENREHGTIIDHTGLDVRSGRITLGCGRVGKADEFQKVNYGIQMGQRFGVGNDSNVYDSLDFTVSHHTGLVQFDENGHAAQTGGNSGLVPLTSSTLLSIEAGSYISGAPTCLILAEVTHNLNPNPGDGPTVFTPVRMTAGFSVEQSYDASSGLSLTIHDYRDNIAAVFNPNNYDHIPAIIEVQAIYTNRDVQSETVPAQQMHTYIGEWTTISAESVHAHPGCSFLCNKIEEWMTAVGLADAQNQDSELYVVIRVY